MSRRIGTPHLHLRTTDSTNARARALAEGGAPHGTVVTAAEQSAGRGRQGRTWSAPPGSALLVSVLVRDPPELLPLVAAVAVAQTVGPDAQIKWPNDIHLDGRKVAGILAEGRPQEGWAVVGVGLNVAVDLADLPAELHDTAATMGLEPTDVADVREAFLGQLDAALALQSSALLDEWRLRDALAGQFVSWTGGTGVARGIDGAGRLVVDLPGGGHTALHAGEVHLGRPAG